MNKYKSLTLLFLLACPSPKYLCIHLSIGKLSSIKALISHFSNQHEKSSLANQALCMSILNNSSEKPFIDAASSVFPSILLRQADVESHCSDNETEAHRYKVTCPKDLQVAWPLLRNLDPHTQQSSGVLYLNVLQTSQTYGAKLKLSFLSVHFPISFFSRGLCHVWKTYLIIAA